MGPVDGHWGYIFVIVRSIILSIQVNSRLIFWCKNLQLFLFQGFSVALFFCFFNSEVKQACRHRFNLWRDSRNLRGNSVRSRRNMSKEYRSRTESVRWIFCCVFLFFIILFTFTIFFLDWPFPVLKPKANCKFILISFCISIKTKKKTKQKHLVNFQLI